MIKVSGLTKSFNGQVILDDLSLEIQAGEILVILGSSGTGKSVLLRQLIGLESPDKGSIEVDGVDITQLNERELLKVRRDMGYLFQEGALYDFMNVYDNLAFSLREHTRLDERDIQTKVNGILDLVDLKQVQEKFPSELSGGMRKRVGLARPIIMDTKVLLCDEPTSGLDPIRSRDISELIRDLAKKMNCTTIITSHDIANSFRIADRVALLNQGKVLAIGSKEELERSTEPFVQEFITS